MPRSRRRPGLAGLDFGAEPSRRAGRQARRGLTRGHVLEAHGQRPRPRTETDDDRHLHDRSRGLRRHDAPDSGSLVRGEHLGEVTDLGPDAIRRPADGLPQRPRACQYLHDHLGELPGQRGGLARAGHGASWPGASWAAGAAATCRRSRSGRAAEGASGSGASGGAVGRGGPARAGAWRLTCGLVRAACARHRARGAVGLAVVWRPARGNRDEPQLGGGGRLGRSVLAGGRRLGRGALAGGGRRVQA